MAQLDHPNIVHLYNFGGDNGCFVLAMQIANDQLGSGLSLRPQLIVQRSVEIASEVCGALHYAHQRGIVHRDLKPSSVLIRESDGGVMVMDFGIAKGTGDARLTATGQTMGTVRYIRKRLPWRSASNPGLEELKIHHPMPMVTLLVGPVDLICTPEPRESADARQECHRFGRYDRRSYGIYIPTETKYLELAIDSLVPVAHCDVTRRDPCYDKASLYLAEVLRAQKR